ncbi:MAG: MotA/TolQ/ExbB proton channel family protein, partial [Limnochordia bacterium]
AAVLAAGIAHYDQSREEIKESMDAVGRDEIYKMEKRMIVLEMIVSIAPLLGILGTVTGIIQSFNVVAALEGIGQAAELSAGIAEALITTAAGLTIAVPTMALNAFLSSIIDKNIADMNKKSTELLNLLDARSEF